MVVCVSVCARVGTWVPAACIYRHTYFRRSAGCMHARPPRRRTKPNLSRDLTSSNKKHIFRGPGKRAESAEAGAPLLWVFRSKYPKNALLAASLFFVLTGGCQPHVVATLILDRGLRKSKLRVEAQGSVFSDGNFFLPQLQMKAWQWR